MSGTPAPLKKRFEKYVSQSRECWLWTASRNSNFGYGIINVGGICRKAHRVSYELYVGVIPEGLCVLHKCDNPPCVRPSHLFLGTRQDNVKDMMKKKRHGTAPVKLSSEQVKEIRECKISGRDAAQRYGVSEGLISMIRHNQRRRKI